VFTLKCSTGCANGVNGTSNFYQYIFAMNTLSESVNVKKLYSGKLLASFTPLVSISGLGYHDSSQAKGAASILLSLS